MNKVVFLLKSRMKRAKVRDLHRALIALGFDIVGNEQNEQRFGAATRKLGWHSRKSMAWNPAARWIRKRWDEFALITEWQQLFQQEDE